MHTYKCDKMEKNDLEPIIERLDSVVKLLAISVTQDKSFREQVRMMDSVGFKPSEIANILSKTSNHIRVTLHDMRRSGGNSNGK